MWGGIIKGIGLRKGAVAAVLFAATLVALPALAADYVPLVYIPGVTEHATEPQQIGAILNTLFILLLWGLAVVAVVMITFYGLTWILSEVVPEKVNAKERIGEIIFGLILVMGTYIILNTINPNLLKLDVWESAESTRIQLKAVDVKDLTSGTDGSPPSKRTTTSNYLRKRKTIPRSSLGTSASN